jgi:hypothetical protein
MPILEFSGIEEKAIVNCQKELIDRLSQATESSTDNFVLMLDQKKQITPSCYYVNVKWFDRGQEVQDKCAEIITEILKKEGVRPLDIIFHVLNENRYYEDGKHF